MHEEKRTGNRRRARLVLITAAAVLVTIVARFWPTVTLLDRMELRLVDWRFAQRGVRAPHPDVSIVHVDDESIRQIGRWPWPRREFAQVIDALEQAGARAIAFDIFFADPDTNPGGTQSDADLVAATARAGIVYHAAFGHGPDQQADPEIVAQLASHGWQEAKLAGGGGANSVAGLYQLGNVTPPLPELMSASAGVGFVNVVDSGDGVFRHTFPVAMLGEAAFPSLALATCAAVLDVTPDQVTIAPGRGVKLGEARTIPIDRGGRMLIDFAGGDRTYPYTSVAELREMISDPALMRQRFEHKIVLVAVSAPGLYDLRASPFSTVFNGVETQANIIANIMDGRFMRQMKGEHTALIIILSGLMMLFGLRRFRPAGALAYALGLLLIYNWLCVAAFSRWGLVMDMSAPNLVFVISIIGILALRLLREESGARDAG